MLNWFKNAAIKKGMSNIRNDVESIIYTAKAIESGAGPGAILSSRKEVKIQRLQENLLRNIEWAISVGVESDDVLRQIQSVLVRTQPSDLAAKYLEKVFVKMGGSHE